MKSEFLIKNKSEKLILFFNGFAMEKEYFKHLNSNCDVLSLSNYSNLNLNPEHINFSHYKQIHILCFSLGIFVFSQLQHKLPITKTLTVVNGTCKPIDNNYGISPDIFQKTYENFNKDGKFKFLKRMCSNKEDFQKLIANTKNEYREQKLELKFLMDKILNLPEKKITPDKVIISQKDRIFPLKNQQNYWEKHSKNIVIVNSGHFPFFNFRSFEEIIGI
jgi:biotin synthesis protein BioG